MYQSIFDSSLVFDFVRELEALHVAGSMFRFHKKILADFSSY